MAFIFKLEFQSNNASVVLELGAGDRKKNYSEYSHTSFPSNATAVLSLHKSLIREFISILNYKKKINLTSFLCCQAVFSLLCG